MNGRRHRAIFRDAHNYVGLINEINYVLCIVFPGLNVSQGTENYVPLKNYC